MTAVFAGIIEHATQVSYIYLLLLFLIFKVDTYFFIGHLNLRVCSSLIGISQSVYRAAVHDGSEISPFP